MCLRQVTREMRYAQFTYSRLGILIYIDNNIHVISFSCLLRTNERAAKIKAQEAISTTGRATRRYGRVLLCSLGISNSLLVFVGHFESCFRKLPGAVDGSC